jgi:DNA-binding NtrC family response regulator
MSTILIAEDEDLLRQELCDALSDAGYRVLSAKDGAFALTELKTNSVQLVITDLRMPRTDGLELIRKGREVSPESQFIIMTAFGSMETAIEALRAGATDYVLKPLALDELLAKVNRIMETLELRTNNRMLKRDLDRKVGSLEMIGKSVAMEKIRELIRKLAPTRSSVMITGESGTGKELIARGLHALGATKNEPFVAINCAAIPEPLLESELFGHQKGAFTGAVNDSEGLFRSARKGTLFLDEIGELPVSLQAKLLRVLEEKMIHAVGSTKQVPFEARVVAATNRNLKEEITKGNFREDLYFRLAVVELNSPPLRERTEDIELLVAYFMRRFNRELGRNYTGVETTALTRLIGSSWKGNIRELQNTIERAMILGTEPLIQETDLVPASQSSSSFSSSSKELKEAVRLFEQAHIKHVLNLCKDDKRMAAKELGISLSSLYRYLGEPADGNPAPK